MPLISAQGLYDGDRINECSLMAQLYYPRLLCAGNGYGRLELSYHKIISKVFPKWSADKIPSEPELKGYLQEYAERRLLFLYTSGGQLWGQWDSSPGTFGKYESKEDKRSPAPPEKQFNEWLAQNKKNSIKPTESVGSEILRQKCGNSAEKLSDREKILPHGIGVGIGDGVTCEVLGENPARGKEFNFTELAVMTLTLLGLGHSTRGRLIDAAAEAIRIKSGESGLDPPTAAQEIAKVAAVYKKWAESQTKTKSWENWFADGEWRKPESTWGEGKGNGKHSMERQRAGTERASGEAVIEFLRQKDGVGANAVPDTATARRRHPESHDD